MKRLAFAALLVLLSHAFDGAVREALVHPGLASHDPWRLLRVVGHWPTWLLVATAFALQDRGPERALPIASGPGLAGLLAEGAKLVLQRERPGLDGGWHWRAWAERGWSTADLGLPSSHAAVAFGGAFALARLYPRLRVLVLPLAAGCALTRVVDGAHFPSDVALGAVLGWAVSRAVGRGRGPTPSPAPPP